MKKFATWRAFVALLSVLVSVMSVSAQSVYMFPTVNVPINSASARVNLMSAMPKALPQLLAGQLPVNQGIPYPSWVNVSLTGTFTPGSMVSSTNFPMWRAFEISPWLLAEYPEYRIFKKQSGNTIGAIVAVSGGTYSLSNLVVEALYNNVFGETESVKPTGFYLEGFSNGRRTKIIGLDRLAKSKAVADSFNLYAQFGTLPINASDMNGESRDKQIGIASFLALFHRYEVTIRVSVANPQGNTILGETTMYIVNEPEQ